MTVIAAASMAALLVGTWTCTRPGLGTSSYVCTTPNDGMIVQTKQTFRFRYRFADVSQYGTRYVGYLYTGDHSPSYGSRYLVDMSGSTMQLLHGEQWQRYETPAQYLPIPDFIDISCRRLESKGVHPTQS